MAYCTLNWKIPFIARLATDQHVSLMQLPENLYPNKKGSRSDLSRHYTFYSVAWHAIQCWGHMLAGYPCWFQGCNAFSWTSSHFSFSLSLFCPQITTAIETQKEPQVRFKVNSHLIGGPLSSLGRTQVTLSRRACARGPRVYNTLLPPSNQLLFPFSQPLKPTLLLSSSPAGSKSHWSRRDLYLPNLSLGHLVARLALPANSGLGQHNFSTKQSTASSR